MGIRCLGAGVKTGTGSWWGADSRSGGQGGKWGETVCGRGKLIESSWGAREETGTGNQYWEGETDLTRSHGPRGNWDWQGKETRSWGRWRDRDWMRSSQRETEIVHVLNYMFTCYFFYPALGMNHSGVLKETIVCRIPASVIVEVVRWMRHRIAWKEGMVL